MKSTRQAYGETLAKLGDKYKEKEECAEQTVIHHFQTFAIDEKQDYRNDDQAPYKRNDSENDQNRCEGQDAVKHGLFDVEFFSVFVFDRKFDRLNRKTGDDQERDCEQKGRQHDLTKFARRDVEIRI